MQTAGALSYFEVKERPRNACPTPRYLPFAMLSPCTKSINVSNMMLSEEHSVFNTNAYCNNYSSKSVNVFRCEAIYIKTAFLGLMPCRW